MIVFFILDVEVQLKMKTTIIAILFLAQSLVSFGQLKQLTEEDFNQSGASQLYLVTTIEASHKLAETDIKNETPFLLLQSGIAPVEYATDSMFEDQYNIYYHQQGCTGPGKEMMKAYNQAIFEYLDQNYGKKWRKLVRKDVIGFKQWRRSN